MPRRLTISPAESSPASCRSCRTRSRVGSPRPRKYLASSSLRVGASASAKGAVDRTAAILLYHDIGNDRYKCAQAGVRQTFADVPGLVTILRLALHTDIPTRA